MSYDPKYKETRLKYARDNIKRVPLDLQKDYYINVLLPAVKANNETVNGFIKAAIQERIERLIKP